MPDENSQKKVETNAGHPQRLIGIPISVFPPGLHLENRMTVFSYPFCFKTYGQGSLISITISGVPAQHCIESVLKVLPPSAVLQQALSPPNVLNGNLSG